MPRQLRAPRQVREGVCRRMVGHQHPCFFLQRGRDVVGWPVRQAKLGCGNHVGIAWSRISEPDRLVPSPHASPLRAMDQKSGLSILMSKLLIARTAPGASLVSTPQPAASSCSHPKAPGSAGGYLLCGSFHYAIWRRQGYPLAEIRVNHVSRQRVS